MALIANETLNLISTVHKRNYKKHLWYKSQPISRNIFIIKRHFLKLYVGFIGFVLKDSNLKTFQVQHFVHLIFLRIKLLCFQKDHLLNLCKKLVLSFHTIFHYIECYCSIALGKTFSIASSIFVDSRSIYVADK